MHSRWQVAMAASRKIEMLPSHGGGAIVTGGRCAGTGRGLLQEGFFGRRNGAKGGRFPIEVW